MLKVKVLLLPLLFFAFLNGNLVAQERPAMRASLGLRPSSRMLSEMANYDVKFYHIDLSATNTSTTIAGFTEIKVESKVSNLSTIVFQLLNQLTVSSVQVNGVDATFTHQSNELQITPATPIGLNEMAMVHVNYSGTPIGMAGIQSTRDNTWNQTILWTLSESFHAYEWFPVKQDLTDKADSAYVFLTVPSTLKAASNGLLTKITDMGNGKVRYEWITHYPIDYYLLAMTVGNYQEYDNSVSVSGKIIPILNFIYNTTGCLSAFQPTIDDTPNMIETFSQLYIPYPFLDEKYGHVMAPIGGGMEHQTLTTLSVFTTDLVSHELAHQWFGDYVTCADWEDIWINEGFASYSEYLYHEFSGQTSAAAAWMIGAFSMAMLEPHGSVYIPTSDATDENRIFDYYLTYKKGAAIIHMLRKELNNDTEFFGMLRQFLTQYGHETATGADFLAVLNSYTGKDYTWFFNQWYYGKGFPTVSSTYHYDTGVVTLKLNQSTSDVSVPFFRMSMDVHIAFNGGEKDTTLVWTQNGQEFAIPVLGEPSSVTLDPNGELLIAQNGSPVSVKELDVASKVRIHPNPAGDFVVVEVTPDLVGAPISIFDLTGKVVYHSTLSGEKQHVSTSGWAMGVYSGVIQENGNRITFRFVKN